MSQNLLITYSIHFQNTFRFSLCTVYAWKNNNFGFKMVSVLIGKLSWYLRRRFEKYGQRNFLVLPITLGLTVCRKYVENIVLLIVFNNGPKDYNGIITEKAMDIFLFVLVRCV